MTNRGAGPFEPLGEAEVDISSDPFDKTLEERPLAGQHHKALINAGVENYEFDHCWEDFVFLKATVVTVTGAMFAPWTKRGDQMFHTMVRRSYPAIRGLDSLSLL